MENKENLLSALQKLRKDVAKKQKKGLHFIVASVFMWMAISYIYTSPMPVTTQKFIYIFLFYSFSSLGLFYF